MNLTRRRFLTGTSLGSAVGVAGCLGGDSGYSPGTDDESTWPMPGYDSGFTAFNPDAAAPRDGVSVRWSVEFPGHPNESNRRDERPVVAADTVFQPTGTDLLALDLEDGSERWRVSETSRGTTQVVVHDEIVYVGIPEVSESVLLALDARDGSEVWANSINGFVRTPLVPYIDVDGNIQALYVGDHTGRVYKIDPTSGAVVTYTDVFGSVNRLALNRFAFQTEPILVGTDSGEVYEIYDENDELDPQWRRKLSGSVQVISSSLWERSWFVTTFGGPIYQVSGGLHTGRSIWTHEEGAEYLASVNNSVVGAGNQGLGFYYYRSGEELLSVDVNGKVKTAPAVAGDLIVAGGAIVEDDKEAGFVSAYDISGREIWDHFDDRSRWTFETDGFVVGGITVADGAVFATSRKKLFALDPA